MSQLIKSTNNTSLETLNRINLIANLQIHAKYENAEYDKFLQVLTENIINNNNIDIYSFFLALNSEICLNLNIPQNISNIIIEYVSFLEDRFEVISPSDTVQKKDLAQKGINTFLHNLDSNLTEIDGFNLNSIKSITDTFDKLIDFFERNELAYDESFKNDLTKSLKKKELVLLSKEQSSEQENTSNTSKDAKSSQEAFSSLTKDKGLKTVNGSSKWNILLDKIEVLKKLISEERLFETSIVYDDVQNLLANFDPKEYFPEVFFPLYKEVAPHIRDIHSNIDFYSDSIQWSIAKKMYNIDYVAFLEDFSRMPENNFVNSPQAKEHFYKTNSEINSQIKEEKKIFSNNESFQKDLEKASIVNTENTNYHDEDKKETSYSSEDELNELFDI